MTHADDHPTDRPVNVLLVDDNPANLLALEAVLADLGHRLVQASSGVEALRRLDAEDFALVLLDVRMPGLDGYETAQRIREREQSRHTPILIFVTAHEATQPQVLRAYQLGALDHLMKPLVPEILKAKVEGYIELYRKTEEIKRQADRLRQLEHREFERRLAERARAETERQLDFVRAVLEHAPVGVAVSQGPEHRFVLLNPAASLLAGRASAEIVGLTVAEVVPETAPQVQPLLDQVLATGQPHVVPDLELHLPQGGTRHLHVTYAPLPGPGGKPAGVIHLGVDLSERRQLEEELRRRAGRLAEADRRKDAFLAILGHELRNLLAPIRNALHVLERRGGDATTVAWARGLVDRQARHMTRLVDDLLDVSRIARGKVPLRRERLDLAQLVRDTAHDHRNALEAEGLLVDLEVPAGPVWVRGDLTRLAQVLGNLLTNAAKFTDQGGWVTVRLATDAAPGRAVITVRDTGVGIEPAMLPRVFEAFAQADSSRDRSRGGLGLGLALVKGLVELHGGQVEASSLGLGQGAEFTFWLPLEEKAPVPQDNGTEGRPHGKALRVLLIEDNRDAAESLRVLLELFGHEVLVAHTGPEGVQAAPRWRPDVVFSDLGLPGMDGYAVARALRQDPATAQARLIALSGYGSTSDHRQCLEAGFELLLTKPVEPEQLLEVLAHLPEDL